MIKVHNDTQQNSTTPPPPPTPPPPTKKKYIYIYICVLNYQLSQKLKLLGHCEFNNLTISLTLPLTCGSKLPFNKWGPNKWEFNILNER